MLGLTFDVRDSGVDEEADLPGDPDSHVRVLSQRKAFSVARDVADGIIVGADTVVVLDKAILGKPKSPEDAVRMLKALSGRSHIVYTGFTLVDRPSGKSVTDVERTKVTFRTLWDGEIDSYVASGAPMDKAGAYGIQDDFGAVFVASIEGCYYNVVGFPLTRFYLALHQFQEITT